MKVPFLVQSHKEPKELWEQAKNLASVGKTAELIDKITQIKSKEGCEEMVLETILNVTLTTSISHDQEETALALLDYGANPKLYDSLALRTSASQGMYKVARKCMEKGADPCIAQGMILHLASSHNKEEIVKTILEFTKERGIEMETLKPMRALEIACFNGNESVAEAIFSHMKTDKIKTAVVKLRSQNPKIAEVGKTILTKRGQEKTKAMKDPEDICIC